LDAVKAHPDTLDAMAKEVTKSLPPPALVRDTFIYRTVVIALSLVAVGIAGGILLFYISNAGVIGPVPEILTALAAASIGALAGLLAPSPVSK
jgi:hypothetical protein